MSAVHTVARAAGRRAARKVKRWTIGLLVLTTLGIALAVGVERGIATAAEETRQAVTPTLPSVDWTPVVDMRDKAADWARTLPPPSLVEQTERLLGGEDG